MMAKQKNNLINIKKTVLIYLHSIPNKYEESWDAPFSLTQMGIANSVGISRQNVPRVVNALIKEEKVKAKKVHIFGLKQRRFVYLLTPKGRKKAENIFKTISEASIDVIYPDSSRKEHSINEILDILPFESTLFDILKEVSGFELDIGKMTSKRESLRKNGTFSQNGLIEPKYFFGRKKEMAKLEDWHSSEDGHALIITGIAGIGKSTFLAKAAGRWENSHPVYVLKIHPWIGLDNLLKDLADFYLHFDLKEFDYFVKNHENNNIAELQVHLEKAMKETEAILVFDDCHNADDDIIMFFRILFEILSVSRKGKLVCIGRSVPTFYDRGKATVGGLVKEILLGGLDKEECSELLDELGLEKGNLENLFRSTKGHPLFIELSKGKPISQSKNIKKYILDEYLDNLEEAERELLKEIAVFRYPVEGMTFESHHQVMSSLLSKGVLHEMPNGPYRLHDIIKDYLYKIQRKKQLHQNHSKAAEFYIEQDDLSSILEGIFHRIMADQLKLAVELIVEHGEALIRVGYSSDLSGYIEAILEQHQTLKDKERVMLISLYADSLVFMGEWDGAIQQFGALIELAGAMGMKEAIAHAHMGLGKMHLLRDDTHLSISNFKEALALYIELENEEGVAETMYQQGVIHERAGDNYKALEMFRECEKASKKIGDSIILAKAYNSFGRLYIIQGKDAKAIECLEKAAELLEHNKSLNELAKTYSGLGICAFNLWDINKAIEYHTKSIDIAESIGNIRILGHGLSNVASAYIDKPDISMAIESLDRAKIIFEKTGEKRRLASVYLNYGIVWSMKEEWKKAIKGFKICIELRNEIQDLNGLARAKHKFGLIYRKKGDVKNARDQLKESQEIYRAIGQNELVKEISSIIDEIDNP